MSDWKHGMFGCFDDCGTCLLTYFLPCYVFGKNAEAVGESCCLCCIASLTPARWCCHVVIRGKIRERRGIAGSVVSDFLMAVCCPCCALIQEAQEVKEFSHGGMAVERE